MTLAELIERQNKIWQRMQEIDATAGKDGWNAELRTNYDAAEKDLDEVSGDIERKQRMDKLEKVDRSQIVDTGKPDAETPDPATQRGIDYREAFDAYLREGISGTTPAQRRLLMDGHVNDPAVRALTGGTDAAGGFLVPDEFLNKLVETMKAFGGLLNEANVITTSTGAKMSWPTVDDTGNVGALLADNTQITELDPTWNENQLDAYVFTSRAVRVPWALLQDEAFGLETWLANALGERIGRALAPYLISGTGTNQPQGLVSAATVGVTAAGVAAITYDELIDLEYSVNAAYRVNAKYVFADQAFKVVRKLKDADGRPLWVPIPAPGFPATINGYSYSVEYSMEAPAAAKRTVLFGDIKQAFTVRQVKAATLVTLKERYADFLQNGYFSFARFDSVVDDPNAVRALVQAAA
jgi:HK97 family phage major capsid protein